MPLNPALVKPEILYPPVPRQPLTPEEVMRVTEGRHRVWMVLHFTSEYLRETAIMESTLGERFQLQEERVFTENDPVTVALYSRAEGAR